MKPYGRYATGFHRYSLNSYEFNSLAQAHCYMNAILRPKDC